MKLNKLIALLLAVTMLFAFVGCPNGNEPADTPETPVKPPVEKPVSVVTFEPKTDIAPTGSKITLATETEGAKIYYEVVTGDAAATLTKENATTKTEYTEPFEAVTGTVYAIAVKDGKTSEITKKAYTVKDIAADSISLWYEGSKEKAFKVYNVDDLRYLADVVSEVGYDFEGVTITLANDITINEKVLKEGFLEPDESVAEDGVTPAPAAGLVNLNSIGNRNAGFAGTFDGAGHVIKGLYIYQAHQGLGFIGYAAEGAVIKDLTIVDACVINSNLSGAEDGSDDDRFGGLIGISANAVVENCVFVGVVGSAAAKGRGGAYEYVGVIGRPDNATEVKNTFGVVRIYGVPNGHGDASANITADNYIVLDANNRPANNPDDGKFNTREEEGFVVLGLDEWVFQNKYTSDNQYIKDAIAAIEASTPKPAPQPASIEPAAGELAEANAPVTLTCETAGAAIYWVFVAGNGDAPTAEAIAVEANLYKEDAKPTIPEAGTLYAVAVKDEVASEITSATYTIQGDTAAPTFEPKAGKVKAGSEIAISTETADAVIYCVFVAADGTAPTTAAEIAIEANLYNADAKPKIEAAGTLYAVAVKGEKASLVNSAAYGLAVAPSAAPYAETATSAEVWKGDELKFYADVEAGDKAANVYYEFVAEGGTKTITAENYADFEKVEESVKATVSGTYYCIAENDGLVFDEIKEFAYKVKSKREVGLAAVAAKIAAATHAEVTATADIKDGLVTDVKDYIISDKAGLDKLAEIVNAGDTLAGYTFTQTADIVYNTKVLTDDFEAPAEAEKGKPNADLNVFAGLKDFAGTYDGNNYVISGLYIYPEYKKAGFIGTAEATTVLKNVILKDACSVISCVDDDHDDRVGGLVGYVNGDAAQITNCIFVGAVGSEASLTNGGKAEYYGGLIGDNNKKATVATDCIIVAKVTAVQKGEVLVGQKADNMSQTNVVGYDAAK